MREILCDFAYQAARPVALRTAQYVRNVDGRPDRASRVIVDLLRSYAEETFVTQTELARRTGLEQSHISRTFNHRVTLTVSSMVAICDGLGISPVAVLSEALHE